MASKTQLTGKRAESLRNDWLNLGLASGLFPLVAKKTMPRKALSKYEARLSRLTINQVKIFGHISTNADSEIRVKKLAHDLDVTPAAASQAVERLVAVGMLDRKTDPNDRRSFIITISQQGREILEEYRTISTQLLSSIYDELDCSREELATYSKVLASIYEALKRRWGKYLEGKGAGARDKSE